MITSREEYEFVNIDDGIKINGEIMPLREAARKNDLRGEDPAFLLEAQGERHAALWGFSLSKPQMTKAISGERLKGIVKQILTDANLDGTENRGAYFIREQLPDGDLYDLATNDLAKELGLRFTAADFSSKAWNFEPGSVLRRSHMENLFADADRLRIPCLWLPDAPNLRSQITMNHATGSGTVGGADVPEVQGDDNLYYYVSSCQDFGTDGSTDWRGAWVEKTVSGGNLSFDIGAERAKWIRPIARTVIICTVNHAMYKPNAERPTTSGSSNTYAAFSVPSTQEGSTVTLDAASIATGAKRLASHYGFSKRTLPFAGSQHCYVVLAHVIPVCEMGDHTRWGVDG